MANAKRPNTLRLAQLGILIALEAIMAFTPLGFIVVPPISATLMHIPVIIGAILLGPACGATLGGFFGLFSVIRAMTSGNPGDMLFNPAASGHPIASLVMAILPRILLGLIAAWGYILLKKLTKKDLAAIPITAGISTVLHTVMVLGLMWFLFHGVEFKAIFTMVATWSGLFEICTAVILATAICKPLLHFLKKSSPSAPAAEAKAE